MVHKQERLDYFVAATEIHPKENKRESQHFERLFEEHGMLRSLLEDQGPFCQSLYSLLYNSIGPKSFGKVSEEEAYTLASTARLKSVSVYLPAKIPLTKNTASKIL